jgi:hypothetical protein
MARDVKQTVHRTRRAALNDDVHRLSQRKNDDYRRTPQAAHLPGLRLPGRRW